MYVGDFSCFTISVYSTNAWGIKMEQNIKYKENIQEKEKE